MPSYRSLVVILRSYDYSEADRILVVFSEKYGKFRAVAKGVRKIRSRLAGCTALLSQAELQFYGKPHQELYLITQGQLVTAYPNLKADLSLLGQAARMSELVDRMTTDHQSLPEIFKLLLSGLELLEKGRSSVLAGIWFEIILLDYMGYRPTLTHCLYCKKDADHMAYVPEQGGVVCQSCGSHSLLRISKGARVLLKKLRSLEAQKIDRIRLHPAQEQEMKTVLNSAFQYQLGRNLNSEKFQKAVAKV
ncbi:DNA repair protein RecO [bacterium]|nr:DNA repair protein RecO [bacterium]